jgi:hypothetical protein
MLSTKVAMTALHRRNNLPALTRGESVIAAKCQTVGMSRHRYHPAFSTYRPSMDIVATLFPTVATYRPSMDIVATLFPTVATYRPSMDIKKGSTAVLPFL